MKFLTRVFIACISVIFMGIANAAIIDAPEYNNADNIIVVESTSPQFEITQNANATTGYSWVLRNYDKRLLSLINASYIPSKSQLAGSGGKMIWMFKATPEAFQREKTETKIYLTYARPWAPNDHPTSVVFTVEFKKQPQQ